MHLQIQAWTPPGVRAVPLRRRYGGVRAFAFVDESDYAYVAQFRWCSCKGYAMRNLSRKGGRSPQMISMHRELMGLTDPKLEVDHRNTLRTDNTRSNLRVVTRAQNMQNRPTGWGRSKHRGVTWDKWRNEWIAYARPNGGFVVIGHFKNEEDAAKAASSWRLENFPFATR